MRHFWITSSSMVEFWFLSMGICNYITELSQIKLLLNYHARVGTLNVQYWVKSHRGEKHTGFIISVILVYKLNVT